MPLVGSFHRKYWAHHGTTLTPPPPPSGTSGWQYPQVQSAVLGGSMMLAIWGPPLDVIGRLASRLWTRLRTVSTHADL